MRHIAVVLGLGALLGACGPSSENNQAATKAAAPTKPKAAYCFFKDEETKGWSARRGSDGNIVVTGKAYREDPRYKASLGPPDVSGSTARIAPTVGQNDGYASADNWWDLSAVIPASAAVDTVTVACGKTVLAELKVPPAAR